MEGGEIWETTNSASIFLITYDMVPCKKQNIYRYKYIHIIHYTCRYQLYTMKCQFIFTNYAENKNSQTDHGTLILLHRKPKLSLVLTEPVLEKLVKSSHFELFFKRWFTPSTLSSSSTSPSIRTEMEMLVSLLLAVFCGCVEGKSWW